MTACQASFWSQGRGNAGSDRLAFFSSIRDHCRVSGCLGGIWTEVSRTASPIPSPALPPSAFQEHPLQTWDSEARRQDQFRKWCVCVGVSSYRMGAHGEHGPAQIPSLHREAEHAAPALGGSLHKGMIGFNHWGQEGRPRLTKKTQSV